MITIPMGLCCVESINNGEPAHGSVLVSSHRPRLGNVGKVFMELEGEVVGTTDCINILPEGSNRWIIWWDPSSFTSVN